MIKDKPMRETWYILEDGSAGDPRHIAPDESGMLRHLDGRVVAYGPHGPRSRSVEPTDYASREMSAEKPKRGYKTRQVG